MAEQTGVQEYKPIHAFTARLPGQRRGSRCHPSTATRWILEGVKLPDGSRLKLKALRVGNRWVSTEQWWAEFCERQTAAYQADPPPAKAKQLNLETAAALAELQATGA